MQRKIIGYIVFALGFLQITIAQDELKRADDFFSKKYYADAIALYEEALPKNKNSTLIQNLADCYYHTFDMKSAARWYGYLISNYGEKISEDYHFKLSQSLKAIGKYQEANNALITYYTSHENEKKLKELRTASVYLENVSALGDRFQIENLALNTTTSEFGAVQIDSTLIYTATKKGASSKKYRWNNQNYLNIYVHPAGKLKLGDSISKSISEDINTKLHEGTFSLTADRKTIYFTRNNFFKGKRKTDTAKVSNLKIYRANLVNGRWKNIAELPFNDDSYSNAHPALNTDGTKLYFASDRPGGFGGFDLYEVAIQANDAFGIPINLGEMINTDKKEQFPFIDATNTLYFSSNGHPGFGLLDVFIAKNENGSFQKPDNIGFPVNSGYDDFSYTVDTASKTGYFASNRPTGKGSDDIYVFSETKALIIEDCKQYITGTITDRTTKLPLSSAEVNIKDTEGTMIATIKTGTDGAFKFEVGCERSYKIEAGKEGYEGNSKTIQTDKKRNDIKDASMDLYSIQEKEKAALLALEKKKEEEKIRLAELEAKRIKAEKVAAEELAIKQIEDKAKAEIAKAKRIEDTIKKETAIVKEKDRTVIKTEEIHFDYSLWYLRRETRERLDKVIKIIMANSTITVEIGTHTDIRGNARYNKDLSQKRADAVKEYFVKNGIPENRVIAKGYGESQPLVYCKTEEACGEEEHELNRRCEFVISKWE